MDFISSLRQVFPVIGNDIKNIILSIGDVNTLQTNSKVIVEAINELLAQIEELPTIDDNASGGTDITYSVSKVLRLIQDASDDIRGNVSPEYDTLAKLADKVVELMQGGQGSLDSSTLLASNKPTAGLAVGATQEEFNNFVDSTLQLLADRKANTNLDNLIYRPIPDWSTGIDNMTNF